MHIKRELKSIANRVLWQAAVILNPESDLVHTAVYPKRFLNFQA